MKIICKTAGLFVNVYSGARLVFPSPELLLSLRSCTENESEGVALLNDWNAFAPRQQKNFLNKKNLTEWISHRFVLVWRDDRKVASIGRWTVAGKKNSAHIQFHVLCGHRGRCPSQHSRPANITSFLALSLFLSHSVRVPVAF